MQGIGIEETLASIVKNIPPPEYTVGKPLRALIFDSKYDSYKVRSSDSLPVQSAAHKNVAFNVVRLEHKHMRPQL